MRTRTAACVFALGAMGVALSIGVGVASSCQTYEPPPTASMTGLSSGILSNPLSPIVLQFNTPVVPSTLSVEIAPFTIDAYGNLPDEEPDASPLNPLVSYTATASTHVTAALSSDRMTLTLSPSPLTWLPTGPALVLLVNPGLTSATTGAVLHYRERIPFSYPAVCGSPRPTKFQSGDYFFLLEVDEPVGVTLKAFAAIDVNAQTGAFFGQFTAAVRNPDVNRCSPPCVVNQTVCELIPAPGTCVAVSTPPVSVAEYPDYVAKETAPNGYTFEMHGCASDQGDGGAVNILTSPGELDVPSPPVSIHGLTFTAQFVPVDGGLVQASGSLTAPTIIFLEQDAGAGSGTLSALSIPDGQAPPDLPQPGTEAGAGADAASPDGGS